MRLALLAVLFLILPPALFAQDSANQPQIDGYVTRASSPTDFDANGFRVLATAKSEFFEGSPILNHSMLENPKPFLGAHVLIFGKLDKRKLSVRASKIYFMPPREEIKGSGVIEALPAPRTGNDGGRLVRADGYFILLTPKTTMTFTSPLSSLADISPNLWFSYKGERRADGVVVASSAVLARNDRVVREEKARDKADYDPAAVSADTKQSAVSRTFLGVNPKKMPPYADDAMEARIKRIGESLVPKFQKDLPDGDPAKLHFHFQVVDERKLRDAGIWPSGVIVVPKQVVDRLENDSQLAAVLADSIAALLENQYYRLRRLGFEAAGAEAAEMAIPYAGPAAQAVTGKAYADVVRHAQEQAARVSLGLMNDAGYTLSEAPKAWWILSTKKSRPLADIILPERVRDVYEVLGTTWRE